MKDFLISVEHACNIDEKTIKENNIQIAKMRFTVNGTDLVSDDKEFSSKKVAQFLREGADVKTTQINTFEAEEYLKGLLKQGKDIIHISFSSAMSGTCNNFKMVAEKLNAENDNKIVVVDSLCQAGGVGVLVKMLLDEISLGKITDVYSARDYVESVKLNVAHVFTVENLKFLARSGRVKATTAFIGNLLQIKPVLRVDDSGTMVTYRKAIGRKKAVKEIYNIMAETYNGQSKHVIISESDCIDEAIELKNLILNKFSDLDVEIVELCPLVTAHGGPGSLALFYTVNKR